MVLTHGGGAAGPSATEGPRSTRWHFLGRLDDRLRQPAYVAPKPAEVMPSTKRRWSTRNSTIIGAIIMTPAALINE